MALRGPQADSLAGQESSPRVRRPLRCMRGHGVDASGRGEAMNWPLRTDAIPTPLVRSIHPLGQFHRREALVFPRLARTDRAQPVVRCASGRMPLAHPGLRPHAQVPVKVPRLEVLHVGRQRVPSGGDDKPVSRLDWPPGGAPVGHRQPAPGMGGQNVFSSWRACPTNSSISSKISRRRRTAEADTQGALVVKPIDDRNAGRPGGRRGGGHEARGRGRTACVPADDLHEAPSCSDMWV